jgi:hypothetical protein
MDRREVEDWFEHGTLTRIIERRTHGITADHVLGELVRRPGDPSRQTATSLTTRTEPPDREAPGEGEWRGPVNRIQVGYDGRDPAYDAAFEREADRHRAFAEALEREGVDSVFLDPGFVQAAVDSAVGFRDRRYQGRRHRPTNDANQWDSRPYPEPSPVEPERYRSF